MSEHPEAPDAAGAPSPDTADAAERRERTERVLARMEETASAMRESWRTYAEREHLGSEMEAIVRNICSYEADRLLAFAATVRASGGDLTRGYDHLLDAIVQPGAAERGEPMWREHERRFGEEFRRAYAERLARIDIRQQKRFVDDKRGGSVFVTEYVDPSGVRLFSEDDRVRYGARVDAGTARWGDGLEAILGGTSVRVDERVIVVREPIMYDREHGYRLDPDPNHRAHPLLDVMRVERVPSGPIHRPPLA